LFENKMV